jgi:hypothetical protein
MFMQCFILMSTHIFDCVEHVLDNPPISILTGLFANIQKCVWSMGVIIMPYLLYITYITMHSPYSLLHYNLESLNMQLFTGNISTINLELNKLLS